MSTKPDVVEALRVALKERDRLRKENTRLLAGSSEPIAIIGMACRYPGGVSSPEELWSLVAEGRDAISAFPTDRGWDLERLYSPDPDEPGTCYAREGGFLDCAAEFDPGFFGVSPRQVPSGDPQQRLLLEASWELLEDAGIVPASLKGSQTGVFVGSMYNDYGWGRVVTDRESEINSPTVGTGSALSGRLAYNYGLEGPTVSLDTACSTSLVAMHLAAQALRAGECSLALAGGASVFSTPRGFIESARQRGLAPDGRSKAFAEAADGVGFSEGVGLLALERLSDAQRNGHTVLAVIRGSAVNQDGASNGMTAPNGPAQERVIRQALAGARLEPADVDAIEAHGTGTTLGDPIEAGALLATYGQERETPLKLGSVKSNIGHPQAAAGVAGVIKTVMAMREGVLPKTLHIDAPSSKVDWEAGKIELLTEAAEWPPNGRPRRAGVSAFGATGTNAHLILEEAPQPPVHDGEERPEAALPGPIPLVLSAKSEPALRESAERLASHLRQNPELDPIDAAYSLATTRTNFERRATVLGTDREQLLGGLGALAGGSSAPSLVRGRARLDRDPVFVFPGYGSQWLGMAQELTATSPVFARRMRECTEALEPHMKWPLEDILRGAEGVPKLDWPYVGTQALFAVTVSLVELWRACGVEPAVVTGHSQGELIAAHVAGGLSLDDAAHAVAARIESMRPLDGNGALASIALPGSELESRLERLQGRVSVAALNGPSSTVVSGDNEALDELIAECVADGVKAKRVPGASGASHSVQVEALHDGLIEALAPITPRSGEIPFHSTVTGEVLDTAELNPEYWYRNLRQPVRLAPVIKSLIEEGRRTFIEVSPHPVLGLSLQEIAEATAEDPGSVAVLGTLRREDGGAGRFAISLAEAHVAGANVEWSRFFAGAGAKPVALPTYPFQRRRFWLEPGNGGSNPQAIGLDDAEHPLLQASIEDPEGDRLTLSGRVSLQSHPWLADHAVGGAALLPASALLELALRAGAEAGCERLLELTLEEPLTLPRSLGVQLQVRVGEPGESGARALSVHARPEAGEAAEWTCHAKGVVSAGAGGGRPEALADWPPADAEPVEVDAAYDRLADVGLDYGPAFQGLTAAWARGGETFVEVSLAPEQASEANRFGLHPALLDAVLHGIGAGVADGESREAEPRLPGAWADVSLHAGGASALRARIAPGDDGQVALLLADERGEPVASIGALRLAAVPPSLLGASEREQDGLLELEWVEAPQAKAPRPGGSPPLLSLDDLDFERSPSPAETARGAAFAALRTVQQWLEAGETDSRLAFLARGAVAAAAGDEPDLPSAAAWGLLRSAQSELPGRIVLIDSDGSEASLAALPDVLATCEDEPQLALRGGRLLVPRVVALEPAEAVADALPIDPERSVLITGGNDGLGAAVARHLADRHGARHVVFAAAGEAADRDRLVELLDSIDAEHPLGAIVHAAELVDNGLIGSLRPEQLQGALEARADAAWNLHELTRHLDLSAFVSFTAASRSLGGVGQANNAAADAFLDALTQLRRGEGLAATTLAWGLWERQSGNAPQLTAAEWTSLERAGFAPLSQQRGLALFDAGLAADRPVALAAPLDRPRLRAAAADGALPAPLRKLVPPGRRRRSNAGGALATRLARVAGGEREALVLDLVRTEVAVVLGHDSAAEVDPHLPFKDLGFDSAGAVELRNRLGEVTGMRLAATLVFDYPSAAELAGYLLEQATGGDDAAKPVPRAQSSDEPIAIVGIACRYPGSISSPQQLWKMLAEGRDAIGEFPTDRGWDLERLYHPDPDHPGTSYAREGGFLYDAGEFDPAFFGISPREAASIDPQQRLLLESSWEALEHAGVDPLGLRGTPTGIFAGVSSLDYTGGLTGTDAALDGFRLFGAAGSAVSGRVSYTFGLEGPAMTIDTACSSSLVAIHLASQALRAGECSLALAGGVSVLASSIAFSEFSRLRGLSPDGRCKAFSEAADGVGWSEGAGVLVLERLSEAEANGHRVLATIRGSAVNQDGASNGMTAPNGPSQERVIRQALANSRLEPADIDAVEAHGTGTTLGDPIEAGALLATYGQERETPLKLGSIKSNIGHSQAAAGVAGVIKTVLAMREGVLPKTLHVDAPSSKVDWEAGEIELLTEASEWKPNGRPRRAGVSSFGASGTNAHLILEEAPTLAAPSARREGIAGPLPLVLSAKSEEALRDAASRLAIHIEGRSDLELEDLSFSLATTRAQLEQRAAVIGTERDEILAALQSLATGTPSSDIYEATAHSGRLAYLFTGQGSQRPGMGKELHETYPAYAKALDQACAEIDQHLDRPLKDLIFSEPASKEAELLDHTTYAQPALFATELALYRLLESFGLKADLLTGHSVGEIVAAHVSGVFSLEDAAKLICARGKLMGELPQGGAMLAIEAGEAEALAAIEGKEELLSLAAINSPKATVLSGDAKAIEELEAHFQAEGRKTKRLAVSHAFHSPLIEPMLEPFAELVSSLDLNEPKLAVISNLSGEQLSAEQATDPAYWVKHAREPVRFADAIATLKDKGATTYLEVGPDAVLTAMAAATLDGAKAALLPTLREGREEPKAIALSLAAAHASGAKLDWAAYFKGSGAKAVALPTYPFQRKRYWLAASSGAGDPAAMGLSSADHPLLSAAIESPSGGLTLTGRISLQTHPWLADHAVFGVVLLPGAAFLELALRAGQEAGCELLEELTLQAPLIIPEAGGIALQVSLAPEEEDGKRDVSIHSRVETDPDEEPGEWVLHAQGVISEERPDRGGSLPAWPPDGEPIEPEALYERLAEAGLEYGPAFQGVTSAWRRGDQLFAEVSLVEEQAGEATRFGAHPALLDAAFHAASEVALARNEDQATLASAWRGVSVSRPGEGTLRVKLDLGEQQIGLAAFDEANAPVLTVASAIGSAISPEQLGGQKPRRKDLLSLQWVEVSPAPGEAPVAKLISLPQLGPEREPDAARAAHAATKAALELIQATLAEEPGEGEEPTRLALLTEGAFATRPGEEADPAAAAVWGLVRSAQSESPGRFSLIDSDGSDASRQAIARALAGSESEPQLALREGELLAPRVSDQPAPGDDGGEAEPQAPAAIDPDRTVLISGATGVLGALVARHLVSAHGARRLLLAGRSGPAAEGAAELARELEGLGAHVRLEACDVASRAQVEALVASIDPEHPLGAVVHAAGVIEDGLASTMEPGQLDRVLAPKVDGAWNLHELSRQADLTAFVMFSSLTGTIGGPGQGNYAAANVFMDALAQHRQAAGLAATSIAWGMWQSESAITADLSEADRARARRLGASEITEERGLELFDAALEHRPPLLIAAPVERSALARLDAAGMLPPILRGLAPKRPGRRRPPTVSLAERLARVPEAEREATVLELVREEAAAVLGHASAGEVPPERPFSELGFDSLAAVEMRNRLGVTTGTQLPATIVFDYPNAAALAGFLLGGGGEVGVDAELGRLELALAEVPTDDPQRQALAGHLRALAADLEGSGENEQSESEIDRLEEASDEELLEFIDQQVGR